MQGCPPTIFIVKTSTEIYVITEMKQLVMYCSSMEAEGYYRMTHTGIKENLVLPLGHPQGTTSVNHYIIPPLPPLCLPGVVSMVLISWPGGWT